MHEVLVNRLGDLSLPMKSVARLTDRPDMTSDVTVDVKQQNNNNNRAAANAENVIRLGLGKVPQILTKLIYCWIGSYDEICGFTSRKTALAIFILAAAISS